MTERAGVGGESVASWAPGRIFEYEKQTKIGSQKFFLNVKNTFVKCRFLIVFGNTITFLRAQAQANPHLLNVKFTFVFPA